MPLAVVHVRPVAAHVVTKARCVEGLAVLGQLAEGPPGGDDSHLAACRGLPNGGEGLGIRLLPPVEKCAVHVEGKKVTDGAAAATGRDVRHACVTSGLGWASSQR